MARRKTQHWITTALFLVMLFLPLCVEIASNSSSISMLERRMLATFPTPKEMWEAPAQSPAKITLWMEDHVGLRTQLIGLHKKLEDELNLTYARFAVRGDDDWLFLAINLALESHQGLHPFSLGEADQWLASARAIKAAACDKPFLILIAPNKHTIYPEKLTRYPRRSKRPTKLETLTTLAPAAGLAFASPVAALTNAKADGDVYYKADSHWNFRGAYEGYRVLIKELAAQGVAVDVIPPSRLEQNGERKSPTDVYGLLGVEKPPEIMTERWRIKNPTPVLHEETLAGYNWKNVEAKRWTLSRDDAPRLLIFGDSFFFGMQPFLKESFSSVTFIHNQAGAPPLSALQACDYDVVVLEMVERFLNHELAPSL